jgi:hypothetical protein
VRVGACIDIDRCPDPHLTATDGGNAENAGAFFGRRCAPPSPEGRRFTILKQACSIRSYIRSSSELLQLLPDAFIVRINQSGSLICGHRRWSFAPAFQ